MQEQAYVRPQLPRVFLFVYSDIVAVMPSQITYHMVDIFIQNIKVPPIHIFQKMELR